MNSNEKINKIFKLLTQSSYKLPRANYWKMGTGIDGIFKRLYKNIKDIDDISIPVFSKNILEHATSQGGNPEYGLFLGEKNITPIVKSKKGMAALTTITQYRRTLCAFGIWYIKDEIVNEKDFILKSIPAYLSADAKFLLEPNNLFNLIEKVIHDSFFTHLSYTRDFAYSIIIEYLLAKDFDWTRLDKNNRVLTFNKKVGKINHKGDKAFDLVLQTQTIRNDIKIQGTNGTYKEITKCLCDKFPDVEDFIEFLYNTYSLIANKPWLEQTRSYLQNKINFNSEVMYQRSKFKEMIFEDRKKLHLIENKNDLYTDLVLINENSQDGLKIKFNEGEAAHIWEVNRLKKETNNDLLKYISDPNNGLIMKPEYHDQFDRGLWQFNSKGEMVYKYEDKDYLFNTLKLKEIKIRPEVFNDKVKQFIEKRSQDRQ